MKDTGHILRVNVAEIIIRKSAGFFCMTVEEYHSPVRFFFSRGYMVHPGCDSPRKAWSALLIAEHLVRYPIAAEL